MRHFYVSIFLLLLGVTAFSQYTQNFSTLVNTGSGNFSTYPEGWGIYEIASNGGSAGDGQYAVGTGSSNTGNTYSFGASGSSERALGSIASGTLLATMGAIFFNEGDTVITTVTIAYTGEQWRYGGSRSTQDALTFEYSLDAPGIVGGSGTWIRVMALDFMSPVITGAARALDGNDAADRQAITYTITGLSIQPGERIVLRWSDDNIAGADDGLAIDDFSISVGFAPGVLTSGGTNAGGGTGGGGGTPTNTSTSTPIFESRVATDSGFLHLYGNLHAHTTFSDGRTSTGQPSNAFAFARTALGMDFLGISEHNHYSAGLVLADYKTGVQQANAANGQLNAAGQPFTALYGMEYGTISGGGHVLLYGFSDTLIGWESGAGAWGPTNNYDLFNPKSDYIALFDKVRRNPNAVALLAHPNTSDFTGLTGGYKGVADSGVHSVVIESGPAFSTSTTYSDYPSSLAYINYYRSLLKRGYRVGAHMDQDNHEQTYGTANANRIAVLSKDRTGEGILNAIRNMRTYATNDYNAQVSFTLNSFVLGSSIVQPMNLTGTVTHTDADGEGVSAIQVYGGRVGGADATLVHSATGNTTFTTAQAEGETWYYYTIVTQADGNRLITAPIWLTRPAGAPLPVTLLNFEAAARGGQVRLEWTTSSEVDSDYFVVERSGDLVNYEPIGRLGARGTGSAYQLVDASPLQGVNYYRLRQVDRSGRVEYSRIVNVNLGRQYTVSLQPNPSTGWVQVKSNLPVGQQVAVQVIDMAGNRVYNKVHTTGPNMRLELASLANGFYVVRIGDVLTQLVIAK